MLRVLGNGRENAVEQVSGNLSTQNNNISNQQETKERKKERKTKLMRI